MTEYSIIIKKYSTLETGETSVYILKQISAPDRGAARGGKY
jgi:hypothetical protein